MTSCSHPIVDLKDHVFFQEGPGLRKWQWTEVGMKVINVTNILADGSVNISNTSRLISLDEFKEKYSHFAVDAGDVVVASSGNTYGKVGRIKGCHLPIMMNTSVIRFRPINPNKLHPDYLYAFLRSDFFRGQIERFVVGSAQPNFGPTHVRLMHLIMPEWEHQRRIASIVSAYDDLIENNTRRIEILEEMARRLYEEWFVNYRFPEEFSALDAEKWSAERIGDVCTIIQSGGTPSRSKEEYWSNGIIDWYKTKELWDSFLFGSEERISSQALIDKKARVFPSGTIMMAIYGSPTVGRLGITTRESSCNQAALAMRPNENKVSFWVFYYTLFSLRDYFNSKAQGAAQQNISKEKVWETLIAIPDRQLQMRFDSIVDSIKAQVRVLVKSNINLRAQRDLLLPKLISGEIDVSDIPMPT